MASGTITLNKSALTSGGGYIIGKIVWSSVKNDSGNYSTVTAKLYCKKGHDSMTLTTATSGTWRYELYIGNLPISGSTTSGVSILTDWVKIAESSYKINHESNGKQSLVIGGSVTAPTGTSYAGKVTSGEKIVNLGTIPRASSITSVTGLTIGSRCNMKWTPLSSSFGYKIKYALGDWSETTGAIAPGGTSATTYSYVIPYATAKQLPDSKTGTMTVTLYSYSDKACTKLIGSASKNVTVTVPDNPTTRPSVGMHVLSDNSLLPEPSKFIGLFVQGKSKYTAEISASAQLGATIERYQLNIGTTIKSSTSNKYTSGVLSASGKIKLLGMAHDSRGYTGKSTEQTVEVIPYSKPSIEPASGEKAVVCERCDALGNLTPSGTYLKIKARRSYSTVTSGSTQYNFCTLRYRYKVNGGSYSSWITLLSGSDTSSNEVDSDPIGGVVSSITTTYLVQIEAIDDIGESATVTYIVPTDEVNFHEREGGHGAAFGKYCEEADALDISTDWNVYGRLWGLGKCKTALVEGEDLNAYRSFGVYAITSNAIGATLINSPTTKAGTLIVSSSTGSGKTEGTWIYILQKYVTYDGKFEFFREAHTDSSGEWIFAKWEARSEKWWTNLGFSDEVSASSVNVGRCTNGTCCYRVVNENHVYVAFNCAFVYSGSPITVSGSQIPSPYKPGRNAYAYCTTNGRGIARIFINTSGDVRIDHVQNMSSAEVTDSYTVNWIDGYIDYWV